jgi:hypothetical protein
MNSIHLDEAITKEKLPKKRIRNRTEYQRKYAKEVRRVSEKGKEQNRECVRKWREKKRGKIEEITSTLP